MFSFFSLYNKNMRKQKILTARKENANKSTYHRTLLLGGSLCYPGAILLCAEGALRSGVGYVTLGVDEKIYPYVVGKIKEVTYRFVFEEARDNDFNEYASIVFGNGMEKSEKNRNLLKEILNKYHGILLIDASGLDLLKEIGLERLLDTKAKIILTPHMGEFHRLFGIGIENKKATDLEKEVMELADDYHMVLVLKDAQSVIGDGKNFAVVTNGNSGLAKAGSGDVLAGFLGGLYAHVEASPFDIACFGHEIFSAAAEELAKKISLHSFKASEVAEEIGVVLKKRGL